MIFILIYKFSRKQYELSNLFVILGFLELSLEFWLLVIWSVIMAVKFIF